MDGLGEHRGSGGGGDGALWALDTTLLRGFRYACRPGCGLCCFASPRVEPDERGPLLRIRPSLRFGEGADRAFVPSRPDGGACSLLEGLRCAAWSARPRPCRRFPLAVHVGERLQADLVLTCPGVDLAPLLDPAPWTTRPPPVGFESELAAARDFAPGPLARRRDAGLRRYRRLRRALERAGRWVPEEEVRAALRRAPLRPTAEDFPPEEPPSEEEGLDRLPLVFDGGAGPVALASSDAGWRVIELAAEGGSRGGATLAVPDAPPPRSPAADRLLDGYLRYVLERDSFLGAAAVGMDPDGDESFREAVEHELRVLGAVVVARADVLRRRRGSAADSLSVDDLAMGIRATDMDWLDRPSWGDRL